MPSCSYPPRREASPVGPSGTQSPARTAVSSWLYRIERLQCQSFRTAAIAIIAPITEFGLLGWQFYQGKHILPCLYHENRRFSFPCVSRGGVTSAVPAQTGTQRTGCPGTRRRVGRVPGQRRLRGHVRPSNPRLRRPFRGLPGPSKRDYGVGSVPDAAGRPGTARAPSTGSWIT